MIKFFKDVRGMAPAIAIVVAFTTLMLGGIIVGYLIQAGDPIISSVNNTQLATFWTQLQNIGFTALILTTLGILVMGAMFILYILQGRTE